VDEEGWFFYVDRLSAPLGEQPLDVEEEVLTDWIEGGPARAREIDPVDAVAQQARVAGGHDAALREHHQVRPVDGDQRFEEERLGVVEVLAQDALHVLGCEGHRVLGRV